uniref:Glucokinase n=1 Tax=Thermogemmatispora argillosa TaxID=2045280 RepID=A0A455T0W6_9CHLR|nr:glucokinase [Thermogemmatispora argillosa]
MPEDQVITATTTAATTDTAHLPLAVGVDLGGTQLRVAVLRGATLLSRVGLLTGEDATPERLIPRICDAIRQALTEARVELEQVAGIGLGAPGPLNSKTGVIYSPPNLPGWENVPIRDILQKEFPVPVLIENDAHCAALGEYMFGAGRGSEDMVYMTVSTGIGGGIICKGRLLEGAGGTAGELGHMTIDLHGPRCNCGNIGCLEAIASGTAIARRANEAIAAGQGAELLAFARSLDEQTARQLHLPAGSEKESIERVNARTVGEAARAGIALARQIISEAARGLGVGLVNVIHVFNPRKIILGGGVMQLGDLILGPALDVVEERAMKAPRSIVSIELAQLGPNVGLIGAGTLIYYHR